MVKLHDVKGFYKEHQKDLDNEIKEVMESGAYVGGSSNPWVKSLERSLDCYVGVPSAVCSSGTQALLIALMAIGLKPGHEVILPDFTFIAAAEMIILLGGVPVFADIEKNTCLMSAKDVKRNITPNTYAIIMTDIFGQLNNPDEMQEIAKKNKIFLIEDAAQSFGAGKMDNKACSFGDIAITSFYPTKPLGGMGEGGALFSNKFIDGIKKIINHGQGEKYTHDIMGINGRMSALQAVILRYRLNFSLTGELLKRRLIAARYNLEFPQEFLPDTSNNLSAWAQYTLQVPNREHFIKQTKYDGLETAIHYPKPISEQPAIINYYSKLGLELPDNSNTKEVCEKVVSIPVHPYLTDEEVEDTIKIVKRAL